MFTTIFSSTGLFGGLGGRQQSSTVKSEILLETNLQKGQRNATTPILSYDNWLTFHRFGRKRFYRTSETEGRGHLSKYRFTKLSFVLQDWFTSGWIFTQDNVVYINYNQIGFEIESCQRGLPKRRSEAQKKSSSGFFCFSNGAALPCSSHIEINYLP